MTIFISYGNINFVTLKMQSDRLCGSFSRAGFFSRLIYCCPLQPWPNILSLGVTTISMDATLIIFELTSMYLLVTQHRGISGKGGFKRGYFILMGIGKYSFCWVRFDLLPALLFRLVPRGPHDEPTRPPAELCDY